MPGSKISPRKGRDNEPLRRTFDALFWVAGLFRIRLRFTESRG